MKFEKAEDSWVQRESLSEMAGDCLVVLVANPIIQFVIESERIRRTPVFDVG